MENKRNIISHIAGLHTVTAGFLKTAVAAGVLWSIGSLGDIQNQRHLPASNTAETSAHSHDSKQTNDSVFTLARCIELALANNPGLAQGASQARSALADMQIAKGARLPELYLKGNCSHYRDDRLLKPRRPGDISVLRFAAEYGAGSVGLSMPLYAGGQLKHQVKAAEFARESHEHSLSYDREEVVYDVTNIFYAMLGQRRVIAALESSRLALEQHHEKTVQLRAAKKAARVDSLRTKVRLTDVEQQLLKERNRLAVQRFALASIIGLEQADDMQQITGDLSCPGFPKNLENAYMKALAQRADYQAQLSRVKAQGEKIGIAKSEHLPEISLQASYGNQWSLDRGDNNEVGEVGIFITLPLYRGGRTQAKVRKAREQYKLERELLRELKLRIRMEVQTAVSDIESTWKRTGVTEKAVEQAAESLRIEREKYEQAKGTIIDVLDAHSELLDSQRNHYRARADYNTALAYLELVVDGNLKSTTNASDE